MENEHYSNKGGHWLRGQANKDLAKLQKLEGKFVPKGAIEWSQRRQMNRPTKNGK